MSIQHYVCALLACPLLAGCDSPPGHADTIEAAAWGAGWIVGPDGQPMHVEFEIVNGHGLLGGDAGLGPVSEIATTAEALRARIGLRTLFGDSARWPDGEMPFAISPGLDERIAEAAREAAAHYNQFSAETGVSMQEVPFGHAGDHVLVLDAAQLGSPPAGCKAYIECSEFIGHHGGVQRVWLKVFSEDVGSIWQVAAHEFGHALGQYHEHARPERGKYLVGEPFEGTYNIASFGTYDTLSIMHYSIGEFGFDADGKPWVTFKPGVPVAPAKDEHPGLSLGDRASLKHMYGPKRGMFQALVGGLCLLATDAEGHDEYDELGVSDCPAWYEPERSYWTVRDSGELEALGRCLDGSDPDYLKIAPCDGSVFQRWIVEDGRIERLVGGKASSWCISLPSDTIYAVTLAPCNGSKRSVWKFLPGAP